MSVMRYTASQSNKFDDSSWDAASIGGCPWLFFGSLSAAENHEKLIEHKITTVLTVARRLPVKAFAEHIQHVQVDIDDHPMANFLEVADKCRSIIDKAAATAYENSDNQEKKNYILVHCASGISRSASAIMVWLMDQHHPGGPLSCSDALAAVRKNRPLAKPNEGFLRQLMVLEKHGGCLQRANYEWRNSYEGVNVMEKLAGQRNQANEIHEEVDKFEITVQAFHSSGRKDDNDFDEATKRKLLRKANEFCNRIDRMYGDMDHVLADRPTKIIIKSARGKIERLFTSLSQQLDN